MRLIFFVVIVVLILISFYILKGSTRICVVAKYFNGRLIYRVFIVLFKKNIKLTGGLFRYSKKSGDYPNHVKGLILSKKITYEKISLKTDVGFKNPAVTALVYGALSGVFSMIPPFLDMLFNVHNIAIRLTPKFDKQIIKISFKCIFRVKIVDIIKMLRKIK